MMKLKCIMNPICGKCGDLGYEEALVCCVMCQDAYEHRYCFNKASDIFKDVKWACEDCLPITPKKRSPKKITNLPSRRSQRINSKNPNLEAKLGGEISPPAAKRAKQTPESRNETEPLEIPNTDGSSESDQRLSCIPEENGNEDIEISSEIEGKTSNLRRENLLNPEEAKGKGGTLWIDLPRSLPDCIPVLQQNCNVSAQPIMDPIWKGSFRICYKMLRSVEGVAAHLSTLACPKAQQAASLLPVTLQPHIVPRSTVWPKSFQNAEPKDENIGLYFFSDRDSGGEAFDSLVNDMISDDLAMCCVVKNAELLVFTSIKLPCDYWRFQGKRYLWGVFRAKQTPPSSKQ